MGMSSQEFTTSTEDGPLLPNIITSAMVTIASSQTFLSLECSYLTVLCSNIIPRVINPQNL